jgi:hypothetical protein
MIMKKVGILRVPPEEETLGLDVSHHGGSAYPMNNMISVEGLVAVKSAPKRDIEY